MKRDLTFFSGGPLAEALGVPDETMARGEAVVNEVIERNGSIAEVIHKLNQLDLDDPAWTAAVWSFGYWCAYNDHRKNGRFLFGRPARG